MEIFFFEVLLSTMLVLKIACSVLGREPCGHVSGQVRTGRNIWTTPPCFGVFICGVGVGVCVCLPSLDKSLAWRQTGGDGILGTS